MKFRILGVALLLVAGLATSVSASQFLPWSFDQVVGESKAVVRGTISSTWSAWDDAGQIIYTYAEVDVANYYVGSGTATITVREIGGTVNGYTQEAIGFPVLRKGEDVILFLTSWEDGTDLRIQAYDQGKWMIRTDGSGHEVVRQDPFTQGMDPLAVLEAERVAPPEGTPMDEFEMMIQAAAAGRRAIESQK